MSLPPCAGRLDGGASWATFAAGTLRTVRDDAAAVDDQGLVETGDANGYDPNVVLHDVYSHFGGGDKESLASGGHQSAAIQSRWTEDERQAFLRRVQRVDPRERRA